jgi:hypothetical protein
MRTDRLFFLRMRKDAANAMAAKIGATLIISLPNVSDQATANGKRR